MRCRHVVALLAVLAGASLSAPAQPLPAGDAAAEPHGLTAAQEARRTPIVDVVREAGPAVVNVFQTVEQELPWPYSHLWGRRKTSTSLGSGLIIDPDGYVLTNSHVIQRPEDIRVLLSDGRRFQARLVNHDAANDVALLKINVDEPLPVVRLGTSADVMVGETVVAIGNPLGNANTVTAGIVSSVFRDLEIPGGAGRFKDFIQLDAPINPGNSGGPLLNVRGEVIGINWAIAREAEGIGFAIPIDRVRRSLLGTLLNPQVLNNVVTGLEIADDTAGGVSLEAVRPGSPADRAGLRSGDVLVSVAGEPVAWEFDVNKALSRAEPGDRLAVVVRRGGRLVPAEIELEAEESPMRYVQRALGLRVVDHPRYYGVLVESVDPSGIAARLPVRRGDLLDGIDGQAVNDVEELYRALRGRPRGSTVTIHIYRNGFGLRGTVRL